MFAQSSISVARCTRPLFACNRSAGYRWSPIPKPPPPRYDRLYGVHSVLNTLRVAAQRQQAKQQQGDHTTLTRGTAVGGGATSGVEGALCAPALKTSQWPEAPSSADSELHPHRAHIACLYVRDFSLEAGGACEEDFEARSVADDLASNTHAASRANKQRYLSVRGRSPPQKKVIPSRYTSVRCITALAKSLRVPVRFVPRAELVQLCGERRNQNIVLEVSSYKPHPIRHLGEIWGAGCAVTRATVDDAAASIQPVADSTSTPDSVGGLITVLFLEHIIDPTNIGGILRTAFFFGVDHVVLSRQCAACTAAVSRTSTGFLEHLQVYQATTSSEAFMRASQEAWASSAARSSSSSTGTVEALTGLELVASAVVMPTVLPQRDSGESVSALPPGDSSDLVSRRVTLDIGNVRQGVCAQQSKPSLPAVRVVLLGNEDAGLPHDLLQLCTHVAHIRSPRQARLCRARTSTPGMSHRKSPGERDVDGDVEGTGVHLSSSDVDRNAATSAASDKGFSDHEHSLRRLARLRDKEVSLNVSTATAALLSALCGVEGPLGSSGRQIGLVDVTPLCLP